MIRHGLRLVVNNSEHVTRNVSHTYADLRTQIEVIKYSGLKKSRIIRRQNKAIPIKYYIVIGVNKADKKRI